MAEYHYKGYVLTSQLVNGVGEVCAYYENSQRQQCLYKTTSLDLAMKWVDAYRDGAQWAVEAKLEWRAGHDDMGGETGRWLDAHPDEKDIGEE